MKLIIDTHLDLAWNALGWDRDITLSLGEINGREQGMTDDGARGRATTSLPPMTAAFADWGERASTPLASGLQPVTSKKVRLPTTGGSSLSSSSTFAPPSSSP